MPLLYVFIDNNKNSTIPVIKSFALGLERDIAAVENVVSSERSNGFVEGNNHRVKVIKRVMYGKCGIKLLTVKNHAWKGSVIKLVSLVKNSSFLVSVNVNEFFYHLTF